MYTFKSVLETFQYNNLVKYDVCITENSPLNANFKGLFLGIHERRGGAVNLEIAKPGAVLCQKGGL